MQVPIQSGIAVKRGVFVPSYPVNLEHRLQDSGVSRGQIVNTRGAVGVSGGPGVDRGGIVFKDKHYRVLGETLVSVDAEGGLTGLAAIPGDQFLCRFAHSFDNLAIVSRQHLFYWTGSAFVYVTDPDMGKVLDVTWLDGFFITTDGEYIVVTELNDPTSVEPLKYGSAESDPDPIVGVMSHREELIAFGRYSIQFFQNVGGNGFPFRAVKGATIPFGCVAAAAKTHIAGTFAFVGSARDEPLGIYVAGQGTAVRVSDDTIDALLNAVVDPVTITMEARTFGKEQHLLVHLDDCTVSLALRGSQEADAGLWSILRTADGPYRPRNAVWAHGRHWVGDVSTASVGYLSEDETAHFGVEPGWQFDAGLVYGEGRGMIVREVRLAGRVPPAFFAISRDGELWSGEVAGGGRWRPNVRARELCGFRFRGEGRAAIARMDAEIEPLAA